MTAEHTPPTAEAIAENVTPVRFQHWPAEYATGFGAGHEAAKRQLLAALERAGLLRPDTPSAALVDAAKAYLDATLNPTLEHNPGRGEPPRWKHEPQRKALADALAGLVAGSDDSTDTLIERVREEWPGGFDCRFIDGTFWRDKDVTVRIECFRPSYQQHFTGLTLTAALRAALASQPKGT